MLIAGRIRAGLVFLEGNRHHPAQDFPSLRCDDFQSEEGGKMTDKKFRELVESWKNEDVEKAFDKLAMHCEKISSQCVGQIEQIKHLGAEIQKLKLWIAAQPCQNYIKQYEKYLYKSGRLILEPCGKCVPCKMRKGEEF